MLAGAIQDLVRGVLNLHSGGGWVADTYVWLNTTSQIFHNASNFSKWRAKKKKKSQPTATRIMDHHLTFL